MSTVWGLKHKINEKILLFYSSVFVFTERPRDLWYYFFFDSSVCFRAESTKYLSPIVTFWNNVLISLCSSVNTQTNHLSMFSQGFLKLPSWFFLVKLYICLTPDICYWTNLSQRFGGFFWVWGFFLFLFFSEQICTYSLRHRCSCSCLSAGHWPCCQQSSSWGATPKM